ncbi:MAG: hypothetical protein R2784_14320 [Saprospiraceae bacterium]
MTVNPIPEVDAGPDTTFCARGGSKQIFVTGDPDFSYNWIPANIFLNPNNMNPYLTREEDGTAIVQGHFIGRMYQLRHLILPDL